MYFLSRGPSSIKQEFPRNYPYTVSYYFVLLPANWRIDTRRIEEYRKKQKRVEMNGNEWEYYSIRSVATGVAVFDKRHDIFSSVEHRNILIKVTQRRVHPRDLVPLLWKR